MQTLQKLVKQKIFLDVMRDASKRIASLWRDKRGVSAIEFSFFLSLFALGILNTVDISTYIYQRMQVDNATEMGAQAAWQACNINQLPATKNCSGLVTAVTAGVQSTTLGSKVLLQSGYPSEGYYCVDSSDALVLVASIGSTPPSDCSSVGSSSKPADYIQVQTTYDFAPFFPGITIASILPTQISDTSWMRMD